jgi:hypothetical protein
VCADAPGARLLRRLLAAASLAVAACARKPAPEPAPATAPAEPVRATVCAPAGYMDNFATRFVPIFASAWSLYHWNYS